MSNPPRILKALDPVGRLVPDTPDGDAVGAEFGAQIKTPGGDGRGDVAAFAQNVCRDAFELVAGFQDMEFAGARRIYYMACSGDGCRVKLVVERLTPNLAAGLGIVTPSHAFVRYAVKAFAIGNVSGDARYLRTLILVESTKQRDGWSGAIGLMR